MNRFSGILLLAGLICQCKTTPEVPLNFDRQARALQEKINDRSYIFYHEKHPPRLEVQLQLPADFRAERELRGDSFVYRLEIEDSGKFSVLAVKPPPDFYEPQIAAVLNSLKFKPAWIGPKNFKATVEIHFMVEYDAY